MDFGPVSDTSTDFGQRFVYIAGLPKSASSLMWLIVSTLQEDSGRADPGKVPNIPPSPYLPLQFDLMDTFKRGGVYSSHAPLTFDTNLFLEATLCRYIVHLRHPADFIVALYCHGDDGGMARFVPAHLLDRLRFRGEGRWSYALSAIETDVFDRDKTPIDDAISHLLRDGPLFKALAWMCDWLAYRHPDLSTVSTYESLMTDLDEATNRLCIFIRGTDVDGYRIDYLRHVVSHAAAASNTKDPSRYPRGWSGEVAIWQRYFNSTHVSLYNETVQRFLVSYPKAETLAAAYPALLLK